jgi:hypothetical protein
MQTHCHSCGAETFPGTRFCRRCGAPVRDAGGEDTGDVSQPGTVALREEGQGRTTDGLAPGEEQRPAAQTTRVSRADLEHLLRPQPEPGGQTRPEHDPNAARLGRDQTADERDDAARRTGDLLQRTLRRADEPWPQEEILRRVAGDRELREEDEVGARGLRLVEPVEDQLLVAVEVADDGVDLRERQPHSFRLPVENYHIARRRSIRHRT